MTPTIVCVLKGGGDFDAGHVARLRYHVTAHVPMGVKYRWHALTDRCEVQEQGEVLIHGWPGWWSKMEAFRIPGPALYLDLDVSIVGDLTTMLELVAAHDFVVSENFWVGDPHKINSSVMGWRGDVSWIYREFAKAPKAHMSVYRKAEKWGDQAFIADHAHGRETWQELLPGSVCSFKRGALMGEDLSRCRVLCSHGKPRPWEPGGADEWMMKHGHMAA